MTEKNYDRLCYPIMPVVTVCNPLPHRTERAVSWEVGIPPRASVRGRGDALQGEGSVEAKVALAKDGDAGDTGDSGDAPRTDLSEAAFYAAMALAVLTSPPVPPYRPPRPPTGTRPPSSLLRPSRPSRHRSTTSSSHWSVYCTPPAQPCKHCTVHEIKGPPSPLIAIIGHSP